MVTALSSTAKAAVRDIVGAVPDPELPMISIADLGVLRGVAVGDEGHVVVEITPTYSGCPAMDAIRADILDRLRSHGWDDAEVRVVLSPAWTTDWITPEGRDKLRAAGIAPPEQRRAGSVAVQLTVRCPHCGSPDTREVSRFGSTACKSLWACRACLDPFDHFKTL